MTSYNSPSPQQQQHVLDRGVIDIGEWSALAQDNIAAVAGWQRIHEALFASCVCARMRLPGRHGRDLGVSIST
jgi:hypothetical protein